MGSVVLINKKLPMTRKLSDASIDNILSNFKTFNTHDALLASVMRQAALFRKKESLSKKRSFQMRLT
ncbi:MAG: hypothetical protein II341_09660, partial [Oscillospiraceae bacterium]|nr:hypothetical protein [Oscillospiraceae bacterium]